VSKLDDKESMNHKFIVLFSLILFLFSSCGNKDENKIEFESVSVEKVVKLSNEEDSPTCSVSLKVAGAKEETGGPAAKEINKFLTNRLFELQDLTVKAAAQQFADNYTNTYKKNMLPLYNQDRADTTRRAWYQYHYVITTETHPGSKGSIAYLVTLDYYEGGAHGINQLLTFNFDTQTGKLLTLSDVFATGYEQPLTSMLLNALKEKVGVNSLSALKEKGFLYSMEMFPSENFILDEETITFVYNPYEIAPYEQGTTELTLSYSDMSKFIKNTFDY